MKTCRVVTREICNDEIVETEVCKFKTELSQRQVEAIWRQFKENYINCSKELFTDHLRDIGFEPETEMTVVID